MAKRELIGVIYNHGMPVEGRCSRCQWELMMPIEWMRHPEKATQDFHAAFNEHDCSKHEKKRHEDFSHAAARIVREATKD
jgi:hypothetical protein